MNSCINGKDTEKEKRTYTKKDHSKRKTTFLRENHYLINKKEN